MLLTAGLLRSFNFISTSSNEVGVVLLAFTSSLKTMIANITADKIDEALFSIAKR